jgi:hypothetical protein
LKKLLLFLALAPSLSAITVSLNGTSYTVQAHPRVMLNSSILSRIGYSAGTCPKGVSTNPAWVAVQNSVSNNIGSYTTQQSLVNSSDGTVALDFAVNWYCDNTQTASLTAAKYLIDNIEKTMALVCIETGPDALGYCMGNGPGTGLADWGVNYWMPQWIMAYELVWSQLNSTERTNFANKMLNDVSAYGGIGGSSGASCTNETTQPTTAYVSNPTFTVAGGTVANLAVLSGNPNRIQVTISGMTTTGFQVGLQVNMFGGASSGLGNNTYPITSIDSSTQFSVGNLGLPTGNYLSANPALVVTYYAPYITTKSAVFGTSVNDGDWVTMMPTESRLVASIQTVIDSEHAFGLSGAAGTVQVFGTPTTSSTSMTIGTGNVTFTVPAGLPYQQGAPVQITDASNSAIFMTGTIPANGYTGTSMTVTVTATSGSGSFSSWNITGYQNLYAYAQTFQTGACGVVWAIKHTPWITQALTYNGGGSTLYPPNGGLDGLDRTENLNYSSQFGVIEILLSMLDDDPNESARSGPEVTDSYNSWYALQFAYFEAYWTGYHQSGSGYGIQRTSQYPAGYAMAIQNSVASPPNLLGSPLMWAQRMLEYHYVTAFPSSAAATVQWGQTGVAGAPLLPGNLQGFAQLANWYSGTTIGQYANYWLYNRWAAPGTGFGNTPGTNLGFTNAVMEAANNTAQAWLFIFTDQAFTQTPLSGSTTTFPWNVTDAGSSGTQADVMISRTGFDSATDTWVSLQGQSYESCDHQVNCGQPGPFGSYRIFRGNWLLTENAASGSGGSGLPSDLTNPATSAFNDGIPYANFLDIAGTAGSNVNATDVVNCAIPRATGDNNHAYGMADTTATFLSGANVVHALTHLVHFKNPAYPQDFVIVMRDYLTSTGETKTEYLYYPQTPNTSRSGNTVTSTNTIGVNTGLLSQILTPQPVYITSGTSFGFFLLNWGPGTGALDATNTQSYTAVVHMPFTGTSATLPTITALGTIDGNHTGWQASGTSPWIVSFPLSGATHTTASLTSTVAGQILIAGITPTAISGFNYTLTGPGGAVSGMTNVAVDASGSIYGIIPASGAYTLAAASAGVGGAVAGAGTIIGSGAVIH